MCGRITLTRPNLESIASELDVSAEAMRGYPIYHPHYNIAPTQEHPVLTTHELEGNRSRVVTPMKWGIADRTRRMLSINARAEGIESRPKWREAFWKSRCAVITDGFFGRTGEKAKRRPLWFHRADYGLILLAGLWAWEQDDRGFFQSFAIVTTAANELMAPIHDRMPAILTSADLPLWLDDRSPDVARLRQTLTPAPVDLLVAQPVSPLVNNVANDRPGILEVQSGSERSPRRSPFE